MLRVGPRLARLMSGENQGKEHSYESEEIKNVNVSVSSVNNNFLCCCCCSFKLNTSSTPSVSRTLRIVVLATF